MSKYLLGFLLACPPQSCTADKSSCQLFTLIGSFVLDLFCPYGLARKSLGLATVHTSTDDP